MPSAKLSPAPVYHRALAALSGLVASLLLLIVIGWLSGTRTVPLPTPVMVVELSSWPAPAPTPAPRQVPQAPPSPIPVAESKRVPPKVSKPIPLPKPRPTPAPTPVAAEPTPPQPTPEVTPPVAVPPVAPSTTPLPPAATPPVAQASPAAPSTETSDDLPTPVPIFRLTEAPRFLHQESPIYPPSMRSQGASGVVKLKVLIDREGKVRQVEVVQSAGAMFDDAAMRAMRASRFYPARIEQAPVAVMLHLPVTFRLL